MTLDELTSINEKNELSFDNCELIAFSNDYFIFYNDENDVFFVATDEDNDKNLDDFTKFKSYDELIDYYRDNKGVDLFDRNTNSLLKKKAKTLIDFRKLYYITTNLKVSDLSEEVLFSIATSKMTPKYFFDYQKS